MERATNKILSNKDFVDFLHSNFLYTNGPSLFKILDQAIKKHATAPQRLKYHTEKYLRETLTSLLERFELYSPPLPPSTPPSTPIVYSYLLAFHIRQVTRLPIRTPSEAFWIRTRRKLDAFLDTFRKLPVQQQNMHNSEENFHFGTTYGTDYLLWNFNGFFSVTLGPTFIRYCGTNLNRFLFKQPSIKTLDLIFDCAYTPRGKKDRDKVRLYGSQIFFFKFFSYISFFCLHFYNLYRFYLSLVSFFSVLILVYFIQIKDRAYQDRFYEVIGGWQLAVFNISNHRDNGHPMLEFTFRYNMQPSNDKWGLSLILQRMGNVVLFLQLVSPGHAVRTLDPMAWLEEVSPYLYFWNIRGGIDQDAFTYNRHHQQPSTDVIPYVSLL
ncbi:unnamed protein product [Rhizophagus irregularis]|nr:unnamed protein product [Rhizophagus irregularis]